MSIRSPEPARIYTLCERMAIPIFVDQILRWLLAECAKPLRTKGAHPDKVALGHWIPLISKPVDAATLQHEKPMLHHMDFNHAERGAWLIGHRVDGEVECGIIG